MKRKRIYAIISALAVLIIFSGFYSGKEDLYFQISKNIELFGKVYKEISFNYVDDINPEQFMRAGIKGMLGSLDPYTIFIDENKKEDIDLITNGKYGGVGVSIGIRGDKVTVVEVMDGYSAQRQGIRIGDILIQAGGVAITPENVDDISSLVKGEPGSTVELKVVRNDEKDTLSFNLVREEVLVKNLTYAGFYPENSNNVYLKLTNFSRSAGDEVRKALHDLKQQKEIKSIVLDLRGNPGGLLDVAVDICDKFLPKDDLIVSTRGREISSEKKYFAEQEPMAGKAKLAVLINGGSASASEIVSGAMQDHDRGILLGTKSFGKGLVQTITPLSFNTSLKITTAKYYTPSGRCIQKIDYSKNNKVISTVDTVSKGSYKTDNGRVVYGGGGITPDTTVRFDIEGDITKELLAKGLFFKFADHYYYAHQNEKFSVINNEVLLKDFGDYLKKEKFVYHSKIDKEMEHLLADIKSNNINGHVSEELQRIKKQLDKLNISDFNIYKKEITAELRSELAARYLGNEGEIKEMLNSDKQFQTAVSIMADNATYNKILKIN